MLAESLLLLARTMKPTIIRTTPRKIPMNPLDTPTVQISPWQVWLTGGPAALRIAPTKPPTHRLKPSATSTEPMMPRIRATVGLLPVLLENPRVRALATAFTPRRNDRQSRKAKNNTATMPIHSCQGGTPVAPVNVALLRVAWVKVEPETSALEKLAFVSVA